MDRAYDRIGLRDDKEYVVFSGEQISHITSLDKGIVVACSQIEENALLAITDTYYGGYSLTVSKNLMTNPPSTLSQIVKVEKPSVDPAIQIRSAMLFEKDVFVIVLTDNKIWKTIDGGTSWNSVMQLDGDTNIGNMDSIVMDNNVAFIWIVGYSLGNLLKTIDAGST